MSICVYKNDNPEHFRQAMDSILNQIVIPDEIVLVIDGPIPISTNNIIQLYGNDPNIKVVRLSQNVGHENARRIGLEHCTYDLVALMDADDISLPDRFEKQIKCFEADEALRRFI